MVKVWGETISFNLATINNFYNGLAGHSSSLIGMARSTPSISAVLICCGQPSQPTLTRLLN
ncbi:hypothetical protein LP420_14780 [Massilia sp. B-10]|nr:hypothetical protein LP420_14780 [Massilia sp. B-10]